MELLSVAADGLNRADARFEAAAARVSRATVPSEQQAPDTVELSTAMVDMLDVRTGFKANAVVFRTADEMSRTLLDMLG